nr:sigma factor-like helix-turn-helix DNA-binding protein [Kribbella shirazensis]
MMAARLPPSERAAYVLREAFGYPHRQISEILQLSAANARQLVCRSPARLESGGRQAPNLAAHDIVA